MTKSIVLFEDSGYENFLPITYTRPLSELFYGILTVKNRVELYFSDYGVHQFMRDYLVNPIDDKSNVLPDSDFVLFINSRLYLTKEICEQLSGFTSEVIIGNDSEIVFAFVNKNNISKIKNKSGILDFSSLTNIEREKSSFKLFNYTWDIINFNNQLIKDDFNLLTLNIRKKMNGKFHSNATMLNQNDIYIGNNTEIKPGVVLDAESGPIFIGNDVKIMPNAVIEGPCFIGNNSTIKIGAKIYENTSVGHFCKIGGEIEESIFYSYSNKQHEGFIGHATIGSWVNIGADTNNSDLKNNYGNVKVIINENEVDTGSTFVGLVMGDHSKCGINTMFNTGTVVGVGCNIYGSNFPPKYIPSFSWGGSDGMVVYRFNKFLEVAKIVMPRRKIELKEFDEKMLEKVFSLTKRERLNLGVK